MIGRFMCSRGRHRWLVFPRPLLIEHPRSLEESRILAGICVRCRTLAKWDIDSLDDQTEGGKP